MESVRPTCPFQEQVDPQVMALAKVVQEGMAADCAFLVQTRFIYPPIISGGGGGCELVFIVKCGYGKMNQEG